MKKRFTAVIIALLMLLTACASGDLPDVGTVMPVQEPSTIETTPTLTPTLTPTPTPSPLQTEATPLPTETPPSPAPPEPYIPIMSDTALLSETPLPVLEVYFEELKAAVDEYGYGDGHSGVVYADFTDLDNDGIPELIYICGGGTTDGLVEVRIYGYSEGLVLHTSYDLYPTHINEVRKATGRNGLSYLTYSEVGGLDGGNEYYSVVNGAWTLALQLSWSKKDDIVYGEVIDDDTDLLMDAWYDYYINGNSVNWESYRNAPETELGITSERTLWNWWGYMGEDYVYSSTDDWHTDHIDIAEYWDTVPTVLAALESLIKAA